MSCFYLQDTVTWLAKWKDSINGEDKCVWLAANSSWKGKVRDTHVTHVTCAG